MIYTPETLAREAALLRAIVENPIAMDVRLVLADLYEEVGEAGSWAEVRRDHIRKTIAEDPAGRGLYTWADLPDSLCWCSPLSDVGPDGQYPDSPQEAWLASCEGLVRRGFVEGVALPVKAVLKRLHGLTLSQPITQARLTNRRPEKLRGQDYWHWGQLDGTSLDRSDLPNWLFRQLRRGRLAQAFGTIRRYDTIEEARGDLSAALVRIGRRLARLPVLAEE